MMGITRVSNLKARAALLVVGLLTTLLVLALSACGGGGQRPPPPRAASRAAPGRIPHGGVQALGLLQGRRGLVNITTRGLRRFGAGLWSDGGASLHERPKGLQAHRVGHDKSDGASGGLGRLVPAPSLPQNR